MADESKFTGYFQAFLWTCSSCGCVLEGGQPMMECQFCEAYKTAFIDIPQDIESKIREEFPDLLPNHTKCRQRRLDLMKEFNVVRTFQIAGRMLPSQSGNHIDPTESES